MKFGSFIRDNIWWNGAGTAAKLISFKSEQQVLWDHATAKSCRHVLKPFLSTSALSDNFQE